MKTFIEPPDYHLYLAGQTVLPPEDPLVPPPPTPVYFFIQFTKTLTRDEQKRIQDQHHLEFKRYIPNFAFLERLDNQKWIALKQSSLLRTVERYKPEYKISPTLRASTDDSFQTDVVLRTILFPETDPDTLDSIKALIISLRSTLEQEQSRGSDDDDIQELDDRDIGGELQLIFRSSTIDWLQRLAEIEEVQWIEKVAQTYSDSFQELFARKLARLLKKNLVAGTIQSGTPGDTPFWDRQINGSNQTIGILDTFGPDCTHCMFRDDSGTPIGTSHRKVVGFRNPSHTISEHATSVAGIVAGDQSNRAGQAENRGLAWSARLSIDDRTNLKNNTETLLELFSRQSRVDGATIHSNSWHQDATHYDETTRDVDNFVYLNEENFVCGANANSSGREELGPPGSAKNAVSVNAANCFPNFLQHKDGKDGPTFDGRLKPDLCAPGCGIYSPKKCSKCLTDDFGCATSWAAPVISGAAALVRQYFVDGFYPDGVRTPAKSHIPSAALIKATLLNSTVPMKNEKYPNVTTGWGLVRLNNTLFLAGAKRRIFMVDVRNNNGLSNEASHLHTIEVTSNAEALKLTLVWTDPPAQLSAGFALVNDLDLVVISPNGIIYRGNSNFFEGFSRPQPDPVAPDPNNVEMVIVADPHPGSWTARVEGRAVHVGLQGYALVASFS